MSQCVVIDVTDYAEWWAMDARKLAGEKYVPIPQPKRPTVIQPDRAEYADVPPEEWNGEGWESLAWHLCAEENGEDACNAVRRTL